MNRFKNKSIELVFAVLISVLLTTLVTPHANAQTETATDKKTPPEDEKGAASDNTSATSRQPTDNTPSEPDGNGDTAESPAETDTDTSNDFTEEQDTDTASPQYGDSDTEAQVDDSAQPADTQPVETDATATETAPAALVDDTTASDDGMMEGDMELDDDMLGASLEELLDTPIEVWTATKTAESIEVAPAIIEVVTAEDFEKWGYNDVSEALQDMLGFYIIDNHTLPNAVVRGVTGVTGSESGLIKVMINGRSTAFRATAGNWLGPELVPWSAVERIEVIRGPASALYGADAFLATVNIVLKKPKDINGAMLHGTLGQETSQFGAGDDFFTSINTRYDVTGGAMLGDFGLMVSFAGERGTRDGLKLPNSSPAPTIPDYNADRTEAAPILHKSQVWYAQLSYEKERGSLTLSAYGSTIERGGDFLQWSQLSNGTDHLGRKNGSVINLQHHVIGLDGVLNASDNLKLTLNATLFQGKPLSGDRIEVASDLYYVKRKFNYRGFNTVLETLWTPIDILSIVAGFELVYDDETLPNHERVDKLTGDVIDSAAETSGERDKLFLNPGVYLQANVDAVPDFLKLTGGVRYDYHNIYGSKVTGRAGSVFIWTKNFTTKLLYGSAFKAPSPNLLYAVPMAPQDVIGNPDLKPQYVHTAELAPAVKVAKYLTLRTALAYNIIKDKTDFIPQGINRTAANVSEVQGISWETLADFKYKEITDAYVSFEWQHVVRTLGQEGYHADLVGTENILSPPWIVRAGVSSGLPFLNPVPVRVGLQTMIAAPRRASGENIVENGESYDLPVYALLGASLSFPKLKILPVGESTFSIRAYNLLDAKGPDPGFAGVDYPLQSRRVMLDLIQTF